MTNAPFLPRFRGSHGLLLFLGTLLVAFLLPPKSAQAQNCVASVTNSKGDSITITGLLTTSDPNENGEGEPVVFTSSGGELSATISNYFQAQTFTFKATQANETISGTNVGFDFDEGCTVTAVVTAKSLKFGILTQGDRDAMSNYAKALLIPASGYAIIAALCTETIIGGPICGLPFGSAAAITAGEAALIDLVATDPSDPNFMVIAQPVLLTVPPVVPGGVVTQAEANAFNALFLNEENVIAYAQALITSYNRAQGAFDAGNAFWENQQLQAAAQYQGALLGFLGAEGALRTNLANLLSADPNFAAFALTINQAFQGESVIAFSGLPPSILQALLTLGFDNNTINLITGQLFVQDINLVAGNIVSQGVSPNLLGALDTLLNTLGITVQISIKPGSGPPAVINPNSHGLTPVAILSSSTFNAVTQVNPASLTFGNTGNENSLAFCNTAGEDVNGDGLLDLVCHFDTQLAGFQAGSTAGFLRGLTITNVPIRGQEAITIVP